MSFLTVSVCSFNRAERLPGLVTALRQQECPIPFEILIVDNNSADNTQQVLAELAARPGASLRFVRETKQGIVPARNRALEESVKSDYMVFMDDDELPLPGMLSAAVDALEREGAECVGGAVNVPFVTGKRPGWLGDELLGFLAGIRYGDEPFWITDSSTPIWTSNAAYRMSIFSDGLCFDTRYNRAGKSGFGGEDAIMFASLLERGLRIRYRPDMVVEHFAETWRLRRLYFLKLHYSSGLKSGFWSMEKYGREIYGVPPFMVTQALRHFGKAAMMWLLGKPGAVRQAMNCTHAIGVIVGRFEKWRKNGYYE